MKFKPGFVLTATIALLDPNRDAVACVTSEGALASFTVTNAWHAQPYHSRLSAARGMLTTWQKIRKSKAASIRLLNFNGIEVGGSNGNSKVWVRK